MSKMIISVEVPLKHMKDFGELCESCGFKIRHAQWVSIDTHPGKKKKVFLTKAQKDKVVKQSKAGASTAELASEFDVSCATINTILRGKSNTRVKSP